MTKRKFCTLGYIAILVIALTGCSTTLHTPPFDFLSESRDESMVIGRVDGGIWIPVARVEFFDRLNSITLSLRNNSTGKIYDIVCDEAGGNMAHFYAALPPGQYSFTRIRKGEKRFIGSRYEGPFFEMELTGWGRLSREDPEGNQLTFEIAHKAAGSPPEVIYIGTLVLSRQAEEQKAHYLLGILPVENSPYGRGWAVRDDYEEMVKTFRSKYPQATRAISKSLMTD